MRKILLQDVPVLSRLASKTFYDTFSGTCTEDDMQQFLQEFYNEEILAAELQNTQFNYFFAEQNQQPAGYILFSESETSLPGLTGKKALELKRLYVLQAFHGKGVAQVMMDFYLAYATQHSFDAAFLGVWEHNIKAQNFYKKYGFNVSGETHDFPIGNTPQTDIYMLKWLP